MIVRNGNLCRIYDKNKKIQEIISYNTCLFCFNADGIPILNVTKYSVTTSKQMSRYVFHTLYNENLYDLCVKVDNLPIGSDKYDLMRAAKLKIQANGWIPS